ncbi:hypothetical protein SLEP1_g11991 [Rubroshorea leprosula]|nr:hypothetical protein SLEP1_g11991 [Rubroshorea leprosula]
MEVGSSKTKGSDAAELVQVKIETLEPRPPVLQTFDHMSHARTKALDALATVVGVQTPAFPFHSVGELIGSHPEIHPDVVNFIINSEEDICNNEELSSLVKEYLENSIQTLEFCSTLENCLRRARKNLQIIQLAVQKFEKEVLDGGEGRKFGKTLDELNKFIAAKEPFDEEFVERFWSVHRQQVSLLNKLLQKKREVDKNLQSAKTWRKVSNFFFFIVLLSLGIFLLVAAAIKASTGVKSVATSVAIYVASPLVIPVAKSLGKLCNWFLNRSVRKLEWQGLLISMEGFNSYITIKDIETILILVNNMETKIEPLLDGANLALREPEAVKLVIDDIKKREEEFMETIDDLGKQADRCSQEIKKVRSLIWQKIAAHSQSEAADSPWNQLFG